MDVESRTPERRVPTEAERYVPELLQTFLTRLETAAGAAEVWALIVDAGRAVGLPHVDLVSASRLGDWRRGLQISTSYDPSWLLEHYADPELRRWSYFRHHACRHLGPLVTGIDFADEFDPVPEGRLELLRAAAERGMRAGFAVPLRQHAPPRSGMLTFSGDHGLREMRAIVHAHGWALHAIALLGQQEFLQRQVAAFTDRIRVTVKQRELLELVGRGLQDKAIAAALGVSVSAVRQRMHALMVKTGLGSRAELGALAMSLGLLPEPPGTAPGGIDLTLQREGPPPPADGLGPGAAPRR